MNEKEGNQQKSIDKHERQKRILRFLLPTCLIVILLLILVTQLYKIQLLHAQAGQEELLLAETRESAEESVSAIQEETKETQEAVHVTTEDVLANYVYRGATWDETDEIVETTQEPESLPEDLPEVVLQFVEKYPEAMQFAMEFPEKKDLHPEIDLTDEVTKGTIPLFIQWDERWGYEIYGRNYLGINGCGPTCLSMVLCGLTGETKWNPLEVARYSNDHGYYVPGHGTAWDLMTRGAQKLGLSVASVGVSERNIRNNLSEEGKAIICSVRPGDFTYTGHFIVLVGLDEDGNVRVNDPNSPKHSEMHWTIEELLPQIRAMWVYTAKEN